MGSAVVVRDRLRVARREFICNSESSDPLGP